MVGVGIKVDASAALAGFARLAGLIDRPRGMYEEIGAYGVMSTQRRFETGTAPDGSPWPPSIRALAEGGKTLIDSARLMQSQTHIASDAGVEWGTNVLYAAIHQFAGTIQLATRQQVLHFRRTRKGQRFARATDKRARTAQKVEVGPRTTTMPARPFIGLDDEDDREIVTIAESWLASELGA